MPGIDKFKTRRLTLGYQQAAQRVDLPTGVNIHAIRMRLSAIVTVAGGAADGVLQTEGIQRFLRNVRVEHDGADLVPNISGRQLAQIYARNVGQITAPGNLAIPGVQAGTPVFATFLIPFSRQYNVKPIDTCLPGILPVTQTLAAFVEFDATVSNAASDLGTGALIIGGDRTVTLANVSLVIEITYSTTLFHPLYIGTIRTFTTTQFAAADTELPLNVRGLDPFDAVLFRMFQGANQDAQAGFNFLTFEGSNGAVQYLRDLDTLMVAEEDLNLFPGAINAGQVGTLFLRMADEGRLSSAVVPRTMPDPRFLFNVDAPTGPPGVVQGTFMTLMKRPGVTRDL